MALAVGLSNDYSSAGNFVREIWCQFEVYLAQVDRFYMFSICNLSFPSLVLNGSPFAQPQPYTYGSLLGSGNSGLANTTMQVYLIRFIVVSCLCSWLLSKLGISARFSARPVIILFSSALASAGPHFRCEYEPVFV